MIWRHNKKKEPRRVRDTFTRRCHTWVYVGQTGEWGWRHWCSRFGTLRTIVRDVNTGKRKYTYREAQFHVEV